MQKFPEGPASMIPNPPKTNSLESLSMRIVSLLPSATEIVCELGLEDQLVGVTHECDYPPIVKTLPKVTQTLIPSDASSREIDSLVRERLKAERALYSLNLPVLEALKPDLIVTQALCDVCAVAEAEVTAAACSLPGRPDVVNLEPTNLEEVFESIRTVAQAAGVSDRGVDSVARLRSRVDAVRRRTEHISDRPPGLLLEWIDPPFSSGHWSPELVELAGGREVLGRAGTRSRTVDWDEIRSADPDWMMIACCGFDVQRTLRDMPILGGYPGFRELSCVRAGRVFVTDGNAYFSRPGPRLVDSLEILAHSLHPEIHPLPTQLRAAERWQP
jgi:iron complex transport system substrate-binding protein